ncbi:glycogen debranching protein [Thiocapsa imhoffii]|uniref:Glycogen debranching protein n=1 Tax=Thiocapsa imhoffii TaxID=382777 RepID=A0A9X1BA40_9GAMM|nr:amylo-alpha-1,6-glucosidase [Thiocapsa imhoffii]MBK1645710.1 glycogen debranching protein [Thiocapsa imhoffii]
MSTRRDQRPFDETLEAVRLRCGRAVCGSLAEAERREWWLANGRGGYAAGTLAGTLTRGYHGLLVAPLDPPLGRRLVVVKLDATLDDGERQWPLHANRWAGDQVTPNGFQWLESFTLEGRMPVWHWACGEHLIEQRVWLPRGSNAVWVVYRCRRTRIAADTQAGTATGTGGPLRLRLALLVADRDHHAVGGALDGVEVAATATRAVMPLRGGHRLACAVVGGRFELDLALCEGFDLPAERARGLSDRDGHLRLGWATVTLDGTRWSGVLAGVDPLPLDPDPATSLAAFRDREVRLQQAARAANAVATAWPPWVERLVLAAEAFLIERALGGGETQPDGVGGRATTGMSVIAGYPWFGDWGRDTMIAVPGLTLATGRLGDARRILETFAGFVDRGMLPNRFPGAGETPVYNTVDAALWYLEAWRAYLAVSADWDALAAVFPVLESIIAQYRSGTRYGIVMDPRDGLVRAGEPGVALTWMDAQVGDWVVTPRIGKPVEINALWYQGLCTMAACAARLGRDGAPYRDLAARTRDGFARFVRPDGLGLYDVLDGPDGDDARIRPNQIFAVSLSHSPLAPAEQAAVVATCARHLLCSYGLRSLAPGDPDYCGRYEGDVRQRDRAYHQGTVWAWLLGPFALASHRVTGDAAAARSLLEPIGDHLSDAGLGSVSEIFDGDPPHDPRGCPAQAWSVACILEAWARLARETRAAAGTGAGGGVGR